MSDSDPLDLADEILGGDDERPAQSNGAGSAFVCDVVTDDGVCGESFTEARFLGGHKWAKHKIRGSSQWSAENKRAKKAGDKRPTQTKTRAKKPPVERAVKASMPPPVDRAAAYTASLSMAAVGCYLAIPPFDHHDLDICNAGMPNVGRALAQLAETNPSVARTCDLILAGGGGGWVALIMAVVPIVGGIAAHHGAIPQSAGDRFGEMIDLAPVAPVPRPTTEEPQGSEPSESSNIYAFFSGTPDTVMANAEERMMQMGGAIPVPVPFSVTPTENPDGERGSEQLRPVEATAEPQSPTGVPA